MPLSQRDFSAILDASPNAYVVLDPKLSIVWTNGAFLRVSNRRGQSLSGTSFFKAFPAPDEMMSPLRESLLRTARENVPGSFAFLRYDIAGANAGPLEEHYWSSYHFPILGESGSVHFILHYLVDITALQNQKKPNGYGQPASRSQMQQQVRDVQVQNAALVAQVLRLNQLFMQAPGFIAVLRGPDYIYDFVNNAYAKMFGEREFLGRRMFDVSPDMEGQGFREMLERVRLTGEPVSAHGMPLTLHKTEDGPVETSYINFVFQPIVEDDGAVSGIFVEGFDVTELKQKEVALQESERHLRLMLAELNHRVKNTLAIVLSIAARTGRQSESMESFLKHFQNRLVALSRTHDELTDGNWEGASLKGILAREFEPYGAGRIQMEGPPVRLAPVAAVTLGLCIHELTVNAAKYGALSNESGTILTRWHVEMEKAPILVFNWEERGGPPVSQPAKRGFGTELLERSLGSVIDGRGITLEFKPSGLVCEFRMALVQQGLEAAAKAGSD